MDILIMDQGRIGPRIAEARKLAGLTQDGLAMLVPCSKSLVSQVERGSKSATPWFIAAVARALRIDVTDLTGQPYRGSTGHADRVHASIPAIRVALNYWDVPPELEAEPRSLNALRQDVRAVVALLDKIDYVELGKRLPGLIEELAFLLHDSVGAGRRTVAEMLLHVFVAAKSIAYRLGYVDLTSVAVDRATQAARETDDPALLAYVAEERSQVFFASAAYRAGLTFLDRAHRSFDALISESEPGLAVTGSMHLRSAILSARMHPRSSEAWEHLDLAREYAARIGRDTIHYGLSFGPSNVRIHEIAAAIELEDPDEALRRNEGFAPPRTLSPERSSHHYIDLARVQLMAGKADRALTSLKNADRISPQHTAYHPMARETVRGLLGAHARIPEPLRSLARRIQTTTA
ncbi:helix-turn-helix transcriptional regulator [Nonomuraea sp. PA05]|uniref:helix-turn-helix domain-containing protein n=1 Tax=Nonomuraea sp. PA05 TaxID=2604466 RepID=UPI0011DB42FB|nr:helix-turn-helix transcriptional regulator [Nonomuraea sp. PA05]TYB58039.1 helix-turn-helix transcriptional regulator [Nonomuraea sp. PA05]